MTLLDYAQMLWFSCFLSSPKVRGRWMLPVDVYAWAFPKTEWDSYPNLSVVTWPCA